MTKLLGSWNTDRYSSGSVRPWCLECTRQHSNGRVRGLIKKPAPKAHPHDSSAMVAERHSWSPVKSLVSSRCVESGHLSETCLVRWFLLTK